MPERDWDNQSKKVVFPREKWFQQCMFSLFTKSQYLCGCFALFFALVAISGGLLSVFQPLEKKSALAFFNGDRASAFEKRFDDNIAHHGLSRQIWGTLSHAFFKEGKEGVLIGDNGWLFTTEEFDYPKGYEENIAKNLRYVDSVAQRFLDQKTKLLVLVLPSKAETLKNELGRYSIPDYRQNLVSRFDELNVPTLFIKGDDEFFLKTDTHWSSKGAELTARVIADKVSVKQDDFTYVVEEGDVKDHKGDLMRYTVSGKGIVPDKLPVIEGYGQSNDLFGDASIPVALVGTSYSANTKWGFEHYLKKHLQADVLNMADEGLGPFEVMDNYLQSSEYKNNKPELVIWEIPVRYLPVEFERKSND